jgi:SAM-dependent MidA family methyltransferase
VPTYFIAHEFFDALPSHKFVFSSGEWREKLISIPSLNDVRFQSYQTKKQANDLILDTSNVKATTYNGLIMSSGNRFKTG